MDGVLMGIHIYPVKSCRAVALDRVEVTTIGLEGDRGFQVVDTGGNPVTQRQHPRLAAVQPSITTDGLRLEADGRSAIDLPRPTINDITAHSLSGVPVEAADAGDEAAAWFTGLLGTPVRLVAMTEESENRLPIPGVGLTTSWADAAPVLVANISSLHWLSARADEPFGMDRFRPNLTLDTGEPWVEDTWQEFSIGAARLGLGLAWPRCSIPQVDQVDGSRHKEPGRVLRRHRWCSGAGAAPKALRPLLEGNALFGIGCSIEPAGATLAVGDEVQVHERGRSVIPSPA
jgi:uncharacterized protein YcbX